MLKINIKPEIKTVMADIVRDLFWAGVLLFSIFSVLEVIKPRLITAYINTDIFLGIVIFLGIITVIFYQPKIQAKATLKFLGNLTVLLFSVIVGMAVIYFSRNLGYLSMLMGLALAIITYYLIILCYQE